MDVLGSLGYYGQELTFLDTENFAYATGTCLCSVDVSSGPKDFIWRPEGGIRKIVSNILSHRFAIVPSTSGRPVEILSYPGLKTVSLLLNPAAASLTDASFFRNGERFVAISDVLDRKYICWNVDSGQLLFCHDLDRTFSHLQLNPANDLQVIFRGDDGLFMGTTNEVLGDFSFKLRELLSDDTFLETNGITGTVSDEVSDICFAIWAPFDHVYIGTKSCCIYDADVNISKIRKLGKFEPADSILLHEVDVPTCALLSSDNLIVGTSSGALYWFSTSQFSPPVSVASIFLPSQISYNEGSVSGVVMDPKFEKLFLSSVTGTITKLPLDVLDRPKPVAEGEDDLQAVEDAEREADSTPDVPIVVQGDRFLAFQHGAVLCATSISMPIIGASAAQVSKRTTNVAAIFVTGSHAGRVTFWKQPVFDVEVTNAPGHLGIRKSVPRVMKSLLNSNFSEGSMPCTLVGLPSTIRDGSCLLAVGSSTGSIEIWKIYAHECEEDEEGGVDGGVAGEEDAIQLLKTVVFKQRLFNGALSLISFAANAIQGKGDPFAFAVGSFFDHRVYILRKDNRDNYSVSNFFSVGSDSPTALNWTGSSLWIGTQSGSVYSCGESFLLENPPNVSAIGEMTIEKTIVADFSSISAGSYILRKCMLAISANSPSICCIDEYDGATVDSYVNFGSKQHSDVVICCALSPNKSYVATGCADGSVYIWLLNIDNPDKASWSFEVANKFRFHADAVVTLSFGQDSSQLCSSSVDGSCFIYTVGKPTKLIYEFDSASQSVRTSASYAHRADEPSATTSGERIWLDDKKQELVRNLKDSYSEKSSEIRAAVNDIKFQLKRMLERNAARSDLEIMERGEFVVDVIRKNQMQADSVALAQNIRETYSLKLYWNELSAARLRSACWDSMDLHSRSIIPFVPSSCGDVKFVSSFSVPRLSDAEQVILDKVKRLRAIEIRSQKFHGMGAVLRLPEGKIKVCWSSATQGISSNIAWVLNDGFRWPCTDIVETIINRDLQAAEGSKDKAEKKDSATAAAPDGAPTVGATVDDDDDRSLSSQDNVNFEFDDGDIFNLLYPPEAIRTLVQKRSYIVLLKEIIRINKRKFNGHFEKLAQEKDDVFASVESRNDRIDSILKELNQVEHLPRPRRANVEIAGSAVCVREEEVVSKPYETESMKQQRQKEEEEKRRRDEEKDKDDIMGRALEDMMHGTLEVKRDIFAEASAMQKPSWMEEIPPAEMDETQLREYEAFEAKYKSLQEEQLAYRKQLELELKKLKGEVIESCKVFDEKLVSMARLKLLTQREILAQELYIARIAHSVVISEQSWRNLKALESGMDKTRRDRGELRGKIDRLSAQCEEIKAKLNSIQEDERSMDKTFKRDIQALCNTTFDQDTLKVLTQLFRIRSYPNEDGDASSDNGGNGNDLAATETNAKVGNRSSKGGSSRAKGRSNQASGNAKKSQMGSSALPEKKGVGNNKLKASKVGMSSAGVKDRNLGPMQAAAQALTDVDIPSYVEKDPFFIAILQQERVKRSAEIPLPLLIPLSMDSDCPEGFNVSQFTWSKLQELRNARIEKEIEGKAMAMKYNDVKAKLELLHVEEAAFVNSMNSLRSSKDETVESLKTLESDLEVVVNLRQGQDEIDKDAIVTDYGDAALIPTAVLDKFNTRIKELGKDKIGILSKIKHFRRKINLVDWEAQHLSLESNHFEEYFTDLQLFRVTRKLQQVIRDGADSEQAKERLDKISLRKDFMQKDADGKLSKMKKIKDALRKQYQERNEENGMLEKKIRELKAQVAARMNVRQSRDDARGATSDSAGLTNKKMKKIVLRRHLVDTARAQAEEIDFLRQELDKIRQKTFPSFIRAVKKRIPNPDER